MLLQLSGENRLAWFLTFAVRMCPHPSKQSYRETGRRASPIANTVNHGSHSQPSRCQLWVAPQRDALPYASECPVKTRGASLSAGRPFLPCCCPVAAMPPQVADTRFLVAMSPVSFSPRPLSRRTAPAKEGAAHSSYQACLLARARDVLTNHGSSQQ